MAGWSYSALDLGRVNVLSACNHHVLQAVCDEQKTLLIEKTDVAGVKPTLRIDRRRRRIGIVPISGARNVTKGEVSVSPYP